MNDFIVRNKDWFLKKVAYIDRLGIQSQRANKMTPDSLFDSDIMVGARLRPLLPKEVDEGQLIGVFAQKELALAQVHELKRTIRGWPSLSVSVPV